MPPKKATAPANKAPATKPAEKTVAKNVAPAKKKAAEPGSLPGLSIRIRELADVLLKDVGNRIRDSGRWPLLIDPSAQAATFLKYQHTNYLTALDPAQMETNRIRQALIGAIRYGKPLVIDIMDADMINAIDSRMDEIVPGLFDSVMDKSILQEEKYMRLVRDEDGEPYEKQNFQQQLIDQFCLVIVTKNPNPSENLIRRTYPIRISVS